VIDRHSKGGARAAKNGFSAMDFVETVPFAPDEGAGTASAMPPEKEASSLFFDDLSVAGPTRPPRICSRPLASKEARRRCTTWYSPASHGSN